MPKWLEKKYLAAAIDPIHIGTGGYRLGRVDLTIVREPVTNVPSIPATSLVSAIKFFADLHLMDLGEKGDDEWCASAEGGDRPHDRAACPICYAFGRPAEAGPDGREAHSGIVEFSDGQLLLFPLSTMVGPVWVTTASLLEGFFGLGLAAEPSQDCFALPKGSELRGKLRDERLNIGWLYLALDKEAQAPTTVKALTARGVPAPIASRLVMLPDLLFQHVVNDNLEVRSSADIQPETGAIDSDTELTYEAVPRAAVFGFAVVVNDYRGKWSGVRYQPADRRPENPLGLIGTAFPGIRTVGLGGLVTRGFGRMEITAVE